MRNGMILASLGLLAACVSGQSNYVPPKIVSIENSKTVSTPKDQVWSNLVSSLSSKFFVVNNIDKSSGFMNVSYSGSPEGFVDCGEIHSSVSNARGARHYDFASASQHQQYEETRNGHLFYEDRHTDLEGRINIIVADVANGGTIVTVNTKYIVSLNTMVQDAAGPSGTLSSTVNFNTGGSGTSQYGTVCTSTGRLERDILDLVQ